MRVPVADSGPKALFRRPHICEGHLTSLRKFAFGISHGDRLRDLVGVLALQRQFRSQLVIRQDFLYGGGDEADGGPHGCVVKQGTGMSGRIGWWWKFSHHPSPRNVRGPV